MRGRASPLASRCYCRRCSCGFAKRREIEEVLYRIPGVREAAVVGEPCEKRGERPIAFLSLDEGSAFDEHAAVAFLRSQLADYKLPRRFVLLPALPRNATGKILTTSLRQWLACPPVSTTPSSAAPPRP